MFASYGIRWNELMFPITERAVQKQLHIVCDYLGYEGISTHSFRKWYATEIYKANTWSFSQLSATAINHKFVDLPVKIVIFHRKTLLICWGEIDPINQECLLLRLETFIA